MSWFISVTPGSTKKPSGLQEEISDNLCSLDSNSLAEAEEVLLHMDGISPRDPVALCGYPC